MNGRSALLACASTLEGVLAAIGIAYLAHVDEEHVRLVDAACAQPRLDENVVGPFPLDDRTLALAGRVWRGLNLHVATGCPRSRENRCPGTCAGRAGNDCTCRRAGNDRTCTGTGQCCQGKTGRFPYQRECRKGH